MQRTSIVNGCSTAGRKACFERIISNGLSGQSLGLQRVKCWCAASGFLSTNSRHGETGCRQRHGEPITSGPHSPVSFRWPGIAAASAPCEPGGPLYTASRQDNVWTEADISRVLAVAKPEMELALMLALWTGQHQGDLLSLPWSAYDGTHVRLRLRPGARSQFGAAGP
jgi:hypothetical protein